MRTPAPDRSSLAPLGVVLLLVLLALVPLPVSSQVLATLEINEQRLQGTHVGGSLLLYSPDPVQLGSSISHWDTAATPNLLMEPFLSADLPFLKLDITTALMQDLLWTEGEMNINIHSVDPPGTGFTDPRPFGGAPGNPATTLGEARVNLFNAVLGAWANSLDSKVEVDVVVFWQDQFCQEGVGAMLAGAAPTFAVALESGGLPGPTLFHAALAEAVLGTDITGPVLDADGNLAGGDIFVAMNSAIDDECLGAGTGWYYGLDDNAPPNLLGQAGTLLHELGHGLGFSNFTNEATGEALGELPGIYDLWTFDNTSGRFWYEMNAVERVQSATNVAQISWEGPLANQAAKTVLDPGVPELSISSPPALAGVYNIASAAFGSPVSAAGLSGEIACMKDGDPDTTFLNGCSAATNPRELAGKIALIDRGGCAFTSKVQNAQAAGAVGAIVVNNAGNGAFTMGGDDPSITIPSVMVGRRDGNQIRQRACGDAAGFFQGDRFQATAQWRTQNASGEAKAVMVSKESGYFWFFDQGNIEVTVKILDACNLEGFNSFWVFAAGMTDVEVNLTVVDTQTGQSRSYGNNLGQPFQPVLDTAAFATCP